VPAVYVLIAKDHRRERERLVAAGLLDDSTAKPHGELGPDVAA